MFRSLRSAFDRKSKQLAQGDQIHLRIQKAINSFLTSIQLPEVYVQSTRGEYNSKDNILTIHTSHKIVASEISLHLDSLQEECKKNNIHLRRILVV